MKTICHLVAIGLAALSASAALPNLHSDWTAGFGQAADLRGIARDSSGNVFVTALVFTQDSPVTRIGVEKISGGDGHLIWTRVIDSPHSLGSAIAVDGSGNAIVTGQITTSAGDTNYYTGKFRGADGITIWEKQYDGPSHGNDAAAFLAVDSTGNITVGGSSQGGMTAIKYASLDGSVLWTRPIAGFTGYAIAEDSTGNPFITGAIGDSNDYYTVKLNRTSGAVTWQRRYDGPAHGDDSALAIAIDFAGNAIVSGLSTGTGGESAFDLFTTKYASADGATLWEKRDGQDNFGIVNLALDPSGNALMTAGESIFKYLGSTGATAWRTTVAASTTSFGGVVSDALGNALVMGVFSLDGPMDFPNGVLLVLDAATGAPHSVGAFPTVDFIGVAFELAATPDGGVVASDGQVIQKFAPLPAAPLISIYAAAGDAPPNTGLSYGFPAGTKYTSFGLPAFGPGAELGFTATAGHLSFLQVGPVVAAEVGQAIPGVSQGVYSSLSEGSFNADGFFTYLAQFSGTGITSANNQGVFTFNGAGPQLVARTGAPSPNGDGSILQSFTSAVDESGYLAKLVHGPGGVTAANDTEAFAPFPFYYGPPYQPQPVRTGQPLPDIGSPKIVQSFNAYNDVAGSPGQGRQNPLFSVAVSFTDGTQALCAEQFSQGPLTLGPVTGQSLNLATTSGTILGARWQSFGLPDYDMPDFSTTAPSLVFAGALQAGPGGVPASRAKGVFFTSLDSSTALAIGRVGDAVPGLTGVTYASFLDPVAGAIAPGQLSAAVVATLAGSGVTTANDTALLVGSSTAPGAKILVREGGAVPGLTGAQWSAFTSIAFPDWLNGGPLFIAQLKGGTPANTTGLWSASGNGALSLLLRTGTKLTIGAASKTISTFDTLSPVQSAQGVPRSYDTEHHVIVRVTFTDNTQALVRITAP